MQDNWSKLQAKKIDVKKTDELSRKFNHLKKVISASPNPYGDDDWATPEDIDLFPGP